MDKLEKYILDNREELDRHIPDPKIWTDIQKSNPAKNFRIPYMMRYVAAALILIVSVFIYLNLSNSGTNALSTPELLESELYYAGKVESLIDKAEAVFTSNPGLKDEMMLEISSLDSIYAELKKDLKDNISNDEVIEALILNYRVKIVILEEMLEVLGNDKLNDKKRSVMNYRLVLLVLLTVFYPGTGVLNAQSVSESRTLEQSFAVNNGMGLDITNKYGKVHLSPSANDSVYIRIEMNASASKSSKLRKLIDGVSFNLISTNNSVIAETKISRGPVNFLENIRSFTNNLISSEMKINIDYYISAPEYLKVKIDNRYGDIYIESSKAEIDIIASNGKIMAEDLLGQSSFDLNFCNADIGSLRNSKINLSYGEIKIDRAGELKLTSTSSKIEIGDIETLLTESKRDKYYIKNISSIEGNSYFTDYDIEILKQRVNLTSRYGNFRVENISHLFDIISIESTYTDLRLKTLPETSFELDAKLNNCYAIIPEEWLIEEKVLSKEREEYLYTGVIGTAETKSKIILRLTRGELDIMQPRR